VDAVGVAADGVTFFVGSLFFTAAACLQYLTADDESRLAPFVQVVGTVLFNLSTFDAMREHLSASQANRLVWTPDALGSICFLAASGLSWVAVGQAWWSWRPHSRSWLIAALNLGGSLAFGVSAVAAHLVPVSDQPRNVALMNLGTFVGAICFLIGAALLLPQRTNR
jgi:hypothetical protein